MNKAFLGKLFLHRGQSRWFFLYLTLLLGVALSGTALRLMSVHWNQRLQGDVNLYALTAREFFRVSRLEYPFKYDYFGGSRYESMRAQAVQHPPLFPLLGGLVSKLTGNSDTFASLKGICFVAGLIALGLVVVLARVTPSASIPVALLLVSFLPIMIDYEQLNEGGFFFINYPHYMEGDWHTPEAFYLFPWCMRYLFRACVYEPTFVWRKKFTSPKTRLIHRAFLLAKPVLEACGRAFARRYFHEHGKEIVKEVAERSKRHISVNSLLKSVDRP